MDSHVRGLLVTCFLLTSARAGFPDVPSYTTAVPATNGPYQIRTIPILNEQGQIEDLTVERGELLDIRVICPAGTDPNGCVNVDPSIPWNGPSGTAEWGFGDPPEPYDYRGSPPYGMTHGALVLWIDGSRFAIEGGELVMEAPRSGTIGFYVNDSDPTDNSGSFSVTVKKYPRRAQGDQDGDGWDDADYDFDGISDYLEDALLAYFAPTMHLAPSDAQRATDAIWYLRLAQQRSSESPNDLWLESKRSPFYPGWHLEVWNPYTVSNLQYWSSGNLLDYVLTNPDIADTVPNVSGVGSGGAPSEKHINPTNRYRDGWPYTWILESEGTGVYGHVSPLTNTMITKPGSGLDASSPAVQNAVRVQYWFFYAHNDADCTDLFFGDPGDHEGDWEHMELVIDTRGLTQDSIGENAPYALDAIDNIQAIYWYGHGRSPKSSQWKYQARWSRHVNATPRQSYTVGRWHLVSEGDVFASPVDQVSVEDVLPFGAVDFDDEPVHHIPVYVEAGGHGSWPIPVRHLTADGGIGSLLCNPFIADGYNATYIASAVANLGEVVHPRVGMEPIVHFPGRWGFQCDTSGFHDSECPVGASNKNPESWWRPCHPDSNYCPDVLHKETIYVGDWHHSAYQGALALHDGAIHQPVSGRITRPFLSLSNALDVLNSSRFGYYILAFPGSHSDLIIDERTTIDCPFGHVATGLVSVDAASDAPVELKGVTPAGLSGSGDSRITLSRIGPMSGSLSVSDSAIVTGVGPINASSADFTLQSVLQGESLLLSGAFTASGTSSVTSTVIASGSTDLQDTATVDTTSLATGPLGMSSASSVDADSITASSVDLAGSSTITTKSMSAADLTLAGDASLQSRSLSASSVDLSGTAFLDLLEESPSDPSPLSLPSLTMAHSADWHIANQIVVQQVDLASDWDGLINVSARAALEVNSPWTVAGRLAIQERSLVSGAPVSIPGSLTTLTSPFHEAIIDAEVILTGTAEIAGDIAFLQNVTQDASSIVSGSARLRIGPDSLYAVPESIGMADGTVLVEGELHAMDGLLSNEGILELANGVISPAGPNEIVHNPAGKTIRGHGLLAGMLTGQGGDLDAFGGELSVRDGVDWLSFINDVVVQDNASLRVPGFWTVMGNMALRDGTLAEGDITLIGNLTVSQSAGSSPTSDVTGSLVAEGGIHVGGALRVSGSFAHSQDLISGTGTITVAGGGNYYGQGSLPEIRVEPGGRMFLSHQSTNTLRDGALLCGTLRMSEAVLAGEAGASLMMGPGGRLQGSGSIQMPIIFGETGCDSSRSVPDESPVVIDADDPGRTLIMSGSVAGVDEFRATTGELRFETTEVAGSPSLIVAATGRASIATDHLGTSLEYVRNEGSLELHAGSTLGVERDLDLFQESLVVIHANEPNQGDVISIGGAARLAGALRIILEGNGGWQGGDRAPLISWAASEGAFDSVELLSSEPFDYMLLRDGGSLELLLISDDYGDLNNDGFVNADDASQFASCLSGPDSTSLEYCGQADFDRDQDVDMADYALLQRLIGRSRP